MPFYSHQQTINNNFLYFKGNEKNNFNNINTDKNKIPNQNLINNPHNLELSPIPISPKQNFSELELEEPKPQKNEKSGQTTTKFFTDYGGYGYKCSCSKTQCNRYYCECFRSGLYCIDCNCKNCQNKPPENYVSNRHQTSSSTQSIAIAKIVKINHQKIMCPIDIKLLLRLNQKLKLLLVLVQKAAVIKNIVNAIKMGANVIQLADVLDARILKML